MTKKAYYRLVKVLALVMSGGALHQAAACSQETATLAAGAISSWLESIVNVFLTMYISDLFGTGTLGF
ncbi:MAG: hypothetical protein JSU68_05785 [Phycisphaerales bacterium]|nr:MAG: hypothetical protein JSU68_05785 [Phycisphaerales bacterium]